jgi:gamma-glutamylcyclotransferase (GGCT)/AIG2-like uncharacterized protein YtfP
VTEPERTIRLFSYGTLQQPEVQRSTFGCLLNGAPDAIVGYELGELKISDPQVVALSGTDTHPVLTPNRSAAGVPGTVFTITAEQLAAADSYEVDAYTRIEVPLRSGIRAWVYVLDPDRQ